MKPYPVILFITGKKAQTAMCKLPLEQHGYPVLTARTGQEGLELVKSREIGLVVVDTSISDRSCENLATEIRIARPNARLLIWGDGGISEEVVQLSDAMVPKGIPPVMLLLVVESLLELRQPTFQAA